MSETFARAPRLPTVAETNVPEPTAEEAARAADVWTSAATSLHLDVPFGDLPAWLKQAWIVAANAGAIAVDKTEQAKAMLASRAPEDRALLGDLHEAYIDAAGSEIVAEACESGAIQLSKRHFHGG